MSDTSPARDVLGTQWRYTTETFQALGHRFAVRSMDAEMGRFINEIYAPCAVLDEPDVWYSIVQDGSASRSRKLLFGSERLGTMDDESLVVRYLTWHVNRQVIEKSSRYVLLHAAAASRGGVGVVLPGQPEAGKTTLVAGLLRSGFRYLTDEAAAIDPDTMEIIPYPKPLTIDRGSWEVLADFAPETDERSEKYHQEQWHVNPAQRIPHSISPPVQVHIVVFPRYEGGSATRLEPIRRAEAMVGLLQQTFKVHEQGERNLRLLARMLRTVQCFRLTSGDLSEACEVVLAATDR